tara:strand:+ start:53 stop:424 length:372 start_codon:yes stop_codon:yes gene_type:complete
MNDMTLVTLMLARGSTLTETDILAVMKRACEEVCEEAAKGNRITTPLLNLGQSIKGVFNGADDSHDPGRHTILLNLTAGNELRAVASAVKLQKETKCAWLLSSLLMYRSAVLTSWLVQEAWPA